jgi:hypothetical protein
MVMMNMEVFERLVGQEVYMKKEEDKHQASNIAESTTKYNK